MAQGRLRKAVDSSIKSSVENGYLDLDKNAAPIAMLRFMADKLDADDGETPVLRYITPASYLSYCEALGLTPTEKPKPKTKPKAKLATIGASSRYSKASNA